MSDNRTNLFMLFTILVSVVMAAGAVYLSLRTPASKAPQPEPVASVQTSAPASTDTTSVGTPGPVPTLTEEQAELVRRILHPETIQETEVCVRFLALALFQYQFDNGDYPTTEEGLAALTSPPARHAQTWGMSAAKDFYVPPGMKDMWGRAYHYERLDDPELPFLVSSLGQDGVLSEDDVRQTEMIRIQAREFKDSTLLKKGPRPTPAAPDHVAPAPGESEPLAPVTSSTSENSGQ